jgi:hypothetical protein
VSATAIAERPAEGTRRVLAAVAGYERRGRPAQRSWPALAPVLSLSDATLADEHAGEELTLPDDLSAECRYWRAELQLQLQDELGLSSWGSEECARRVVGRALLELDGHHDRQVIADALGTSITTLERDRSAVKHLPGGKSRG